MPKTELLEPGKLALIQQLPDGRIAQIGLTQAQSDLLQAFCASLGTMVRLGKEHDLLLASNPPKPAN